MSNYPSTALQKLLATSEPGRGVVTRVSGSVVTVAIAQGLRVYPSAVTLSVGAQVSLRNGMAYPGATPTRKYRL